MLLLLVTNSNGRGLRRKNGQFQQISAGWPILDARIAGRRSQEGQGGFGVVRTNLKTHATAQRPSSLVMFASARKHSIPADSRQPLAMSASDISPKCRMVTSSFVMDSLERD